MILGQLMHILIQDFILLIYSFFCCVGDGRAMGNFIGDLCSVSVFVSHITQ